MLDNNHPFSPPRIVVDPPSPQSSSSGMSTSPMSPRTEECFSRTHPSFHPVLRHLRTPLCPLVSTTTGLPHPDFPKNLLAFHLLTSAQLDNLARHFHQVWPPVPATTSYPVMVQAWLGTDAKEQVDLSTKRRRFGRFIGLRGCESPIRDRAPETSWPSSSRKAEPEPESTAEMLARMEREWDECLLRSREDSEAALRMKFGHFN